MMEEILKAILQGADGSPAPQQRSQDPLADLIGAVLGGAATQPAPQPQQQLPAGDPLSELIKGVLGGEPQAPQAPGGGGTIIDILGSILGGGRPGGQNNSFLRPIAEALSDKLGISPEIALIVINLAIGLLLSRQRDQTGGGAGDYRRGGSAPAQEGFDLDDLLDENYLQATGATSQLARQTGMNETQATHSLQEALMLLNNQTTRRASSQKEGGLDHLLDSWDDR